MLNEEVQVLKDMIPFGIKLFIWIPHTFTQCLGEHKINEKSLQLLMNYTAKMPVVWNGTHSRSPRWVWSTLLPVPTFLTLTHYWGLLLVHVRRNWKYCLVVGCFCAPLRLQFTSMSVHTHIISCMLWLIDSMVTWSQWPWLLISDHQNLTCSS